MRCSNVLISLFVIMCCIFSTFNTCESVLGTAAKDFFRGQNSMGILDRLKIGDYLLSSNGKYKFKLENDGNLTLTETNNEKILWESSTSNLGGIFLVLNSRGRLLLRSNLGSAVWSAPNSVGSGSNKLILNDDGSLALYAYGEEIWVVNDTIEGEGPTSLYNGSIIVPEQNSMSLMILKPELTDDWNKSSSIIWSWNVKSANGVPSSEKTKYKSVFTNLSDVKRVVYNERVYLMFCGSHGNGIATLDMELKEVVYWANAGGSPHAIAGLPDGNMAVADAKGRIKLFCTSINNKPAAQEFVHAGAHGVVWDGKRELLWAWGGTKLQSYSYNNSKLKPRLTPIKTYRLPSNWGDGGGHDLAPMQDTDNLLFSWRLGIGLFNIRTETFSKYSDKGPNPKGLSHNPYRGEIIYTRPDSSDSRTYRVRSLTKPDRIMKEGKWYKARWFIPNTFSYIE